jgi:DNA-binding transcriptional regulator GbsR (MarR family)
LNLLNVQYVLNESNASGVGGVEGLRGAALDTATTQFTDRMGLLFAAEGQPPIAGRIFGYLLLSDDPCSLDQLARALRVSKASVSTNARLLADKGVLERVCRPSDRHDYYGVASDLFSRTMAERMRRWQRFTETVGEARRTLPIRSERVRARLRGYEKAYAFMVDAIGQAVGHWERGGAGRAGSRLAHGSKR